MSCRYRVSVLIPCHSVKYLHGAISSINNQTLSKDIFEVLVVADRIDIFDIDQILNRTQLNYRIIQSEVPGIVPALNLGLQNINSEFVARMDDDDLMISTRLESQLDYLEKNPKIVAVGGQLQLINKEDQPIGIATYRKKVSMNYRVLLRTSPLAHPATMFRLESVRSVGGYRSFLAEDWDLWIRLSEIGSIGNLNIAVLKYRIHDEQLSREIIYKQSISRQYLSTSLFARKLGINDQPKSTEAPGEWLLNTQAYLRRNSSEYCKCEKYVRKISEINAIVEVDSRIELIIRTIVLGVKFPFQFTKYVIGAVMRKIRGNFD